MYLLMWAFEGELGVSSFVALPDIKEGRDVGK